MQAFLWFIFSALSLVWIYGNYRYAQENYPNSTAWRLFLFLTGFVSGIVAGIALTLDSSSNEGQVILVLIIGLFSGLISGFLFPINMMNIIPKKKE